MALEFVAIADEHPIMVDGLSRVLAAYGAYSIVGSGDAAQAAEIARSSRPKSIILGMTDTDRLLSTISLITSECPAVGVIVYASVPSVDHAVRALEAGAKGYALKAIGAEEILRAVESVHAGEIYITRAFATGVITALRNEAARKAALQRIALSARENQIVHLLLQGATNKAIATRLGIREKTVKHYMTSLMQKLSARNRTEAVLAAQQLIDVRFNSGSRIPTTMQATVRHS